MMKERIGLLGGTFDPIHLGHIHLGTSLCEKNILDRIIFIPAAFPPHKKNITSSCHRMAMLSLALEDYSSLQFSKVEVKRGGTSYTLTTVEYFLHIYRKEKLFLLFGSDCLQTFDTWFKVNRIIELCDIITYLRPGFHFPEKEKLIATFGVSQGKKLYDGLFYGKTTNINSTAIRSMIRKKQDVFSYLHPKVISYIEDHMLYR